MIQDEALQDLSDLLDIHERSILGKMHTGMMAKVTAFDPSGSVDVQPVFVMQFEDDETLEYPVIPNVPVCYPVCGSFEITFPLEEGDNVFLSFNERSLDEWKTNDASSYNPASKRKLDLSDAVAIPIMRAGTKGAIDALTIGNRSAARIRMDGQNLNIQNATSDLIPDLIEALNNLITPANIVTPAGAGSFNAATIAAVQAVITKLETF